MNQHPYWRAYMAGLVVPNLVFIFFMIGFTFFRYVYDVPIPVERVIVFPMTIVPNLWGLWNVLHLSLGRRIPLGAFGAILPFLLVPGGYLLAQATHFGIPPFVYHYAAFGFPVGVAVYYLAWKYIVGSLNQVVGVA